MVCFHHCVERSRCGPPHAGDAAAGRGARHLPPAVRRRAVRQVQVLDAVDVAPRRRLHQGTVRCGSHALSREVCPGPRCPKLAPLCVCGCLCVRLRQLFTFGPVVSDGYGVGYFIKPDHMCFNITAWNNSTKTPASDLTAALSDALKTMLALE